MNNIAWICVATIVLALIASVAFVVIRRGQAEGNVHVGDFGVGFRGKARNRAQIADSSSSEGGAIASSDGDATISNTHVKKDLWAEGRAVENDPKA